MERRRDGSIAGRGILLTDLGKLRWRSPIAEPHLTRIVRGTIETPVWPAEEATHELKLEDLEDVRTDPAIANLRMKPAKVVVADDEDLMFDAHAGGEPEPTDLEEPESAGESPSVVASLEDLREIQRQRQQEAAEAAKEREVVNAIAAELGRHAAEKAAAQENQGPEPAEPDIFEVENPENLIEPADWEIPETTVPVPPAPGSFITLFQGPGEGKTARITDTCSAIYLDYDGENSRAYLRINHEASDAYESVHLDLRDPEQKIFVTDEGIAIELRANLERISAVMLEPPDNLFPNFKPGIKAVHEIDSAFWPYSAKTVQPVDVGHGYYLILRGGGFIRKDNNMEASLELYLSERGNPKEYSRNPGYLRIFRLDGTKNKKSFTIGNVRVDIELSGLGVRIKRRQKERTKVPLPKPERREPWAVHSDSGAFEEAFAKLEGIEADVPVEPHGFEDVMGGPEKVPPAPEHQPADTVSVTVFEELCRVVEKSGLSEEHIRFLTEGISSRDPRIRVLATKAFADAAQRGEDIEMARGYLIAALQDSVKDVKNNSNDALYYATANGMELDPVLRATLEDPRRREEPSVLLAVKDLRELLPKKD